MSCNQQKVFLESACWRSAVCQDQRQTNVGIKGNHEGVFSTDMLSIGRGSLDFKHFKVFAEKMTHYHSSLIHAFFS